MYYRLREDYALREWKFFTRALYHRLLPSPFQIDQEAYELLKKCDGETDFAETDGVLSLMKNGIIEPCEKGNHPSEWSAFRKYDHRFMPAMNLKLTGKCNLNCRHCFNAKDNEHLMSEWEWDDLIRLLDEASECGVHAITLTGGEPMVHSRFYDVVREIYRCNMVLDKLTTNGHFITEETLVFFKSLNCDPQIKISFDGIGHHDWMRRYPGAEKIALNALRMCSEQGFETMAQVQVYKGNLDTMAETLRVLDETGVSLVRLIRTTKTVRWHENAPYSQRH